MSPTVSETIEWVAQYHCRDTGDGVKDFCGNCGGDWPCHITRLAADVKLCRSAINKQIETNTKLRLANTNLEVRRARSHQIATERGQIISECAGLIPIAGPLIKRIQFLMQAPRTIETGQIDYARMTSEQRAKIERLRESLECLVHRCEAEGCGTAWAPIADARELLKEIK